MRRKAELRGGGRDYLEPVRRRVNPATPPRAMELPPQVHHHAAADRVRQLGGERAPGAVPPHEEVRPKL